MYRLKESDWSRKEDISQVFNNDFNEWSHVEIERV